MTTYKESVYKFTDPIRYFKENDPYYWEIDNIPLKQLQENVLWIKDQLNLIPQEGDQVDFGVSRSDINELKPFVDGTGSLIFVNPGRFTARINDAYNKTPLQKLNQLTGNSDSVSSLSQFRTQYQANNATTDYAAFLVERLRSSFAESALNMNGLIERVLTWDPTIQTANTVAPQTSNSWPILALADSVKKFVSSTVNRNSQVLANEFVKQFRGVARTAVVDVPSALSIEVPAFDSRDFFYQTDNGTTQYIDGATIRIDLLFIYSKPIDTASTTINKWQNNQPTTIFTPQLGLVKGAGVGVRSILGNGNLTKYQSPRDSDGNTQIMAHVADTSIPTNGFQSLNIHGSFPSPDDLMNLAPSIQEKLESSDPRLIGQTVLPVAYIVVKNNSAVTTDGNPILTSVDIIDIRPFFRTTELAYNERAGICAAVPSLSLANPVATAYNLEKTIEDFRTYADNSYAPIGIIEASKVVAAGFIYGGKDFGPEKYIAPTTANVGWDLSKHAADNILNEGFWRHIDIGSYQGGFPGDSYNGFFGGYNLEHSTGLPLVWNKIISVTGIQTSFSDYIVDAQFHNCVPKTGNGVQYNISGEDNELYVVDSKHTGLYITKLPSEPNTIKFTITVVATLARRSRITDSTIITIKESLTEKKASLFITRNMAFTQVDTSTGKLANSFLDVIHPSVQFKVTVLGNTAYSFGSSDTGDAEIQSYV